MRAVGLNKTEELSEAITKTPIAHTDGVLTMTASGGSVATPGDDPRAEPFVQVVEVDFDAARGFGGMTKASPGWPTPGPLRKQARP